MSPRFPLPRVNPDFLVRPQLMALLDRWSPITVLLAPSGAGKAVLATRWATHAVTEGDDVIWVDGEVDEPADVVAALARHAGVDPSPDPSTTLRLMRRRLQGLDRRLALVMNNAEPILEAIGDGLVEVVRDCHDVHLVACLRRRLDPVAKALLEAETRIVGAADFLFTTAEVQQLALLHDLVLDEAEAEDVRAATGGSAALLRTGLESLPDSDGRTVTRWSPRHVAWFLTVNLVPTLPSAAWSALRRAALVEEPTYGAVLAATGPLDDDARIPLEIIGILDPLISSGEPLVRLPPVMRDYFRGCYDDAELGPPAVLHASVARHWLAAAEPGRALRQAVAGRAWPLAVDIVDEHWWELLVEDPAGLRRDLRRIPPSEIRDRPRVEIGRQLIAPDETDPESPALRAWTADLLSTSDEDHAARAPESVAQALDLLALLVRREIGRGDLAAAARLARRAEPLAAALRTSGPGPAAPVLRRAAWQTGTVWLLTGETTAATTDLRTAVDGTDGRDAVAADAAGRLALGAVLQGDREAASHWQDQWRAVRPPDTGPAPAVDAAARIAQAADRVQALDPDDTELRALRQEVPVDHELWPFTLWVESQHALAWGGRSRVSARLAGARERAQPGRDWIAGLLGAAEAEIWLSLGRTGPATQVLAELDPGSAFAAVTRARLALSTGRAEDAQLLLQPALSTGHPFVSARIEALVLAAWCQDEPDHVAARELLTDAVRIAQRERLALPFSRVPRRLLDAHRAAVPGLAEILAMLDEARVRPPQTEVHDLPDLTPRETTVLSALARGLSLDQAARELFVSRNTVKTQASSLYRKLGVRDRHDAVRRGYQLGLLG
ncbi:LuxR C-terminal-related transcriptional regulator [Nocardioides sp. W7]|uniref:LuxR C-terminal-related transcriptional regulator n=1 Tax=Nocardioides sp. W7 TaxID=2931390 RepID=UPI0024684C10|nr:LuxR C-terminal-related transcriptional regulator [Nocardioides sp. W7]